MFGMNIRIAEKRWIVHISQKYVLEYFLVYNFAVHLKKTAGPGQLGPSQLGPGLLGPGQLG